MPTYTARMTGTGAATTTTATTTAGDLGGSVGSLPALDAIGGKPCACGFFAGSNFGRVPPEIDSGEVGAHLVLLVANVFSGSYAQLTVSVVTEALLMEEEPVRVTGAELPVTRVRSCDKAGYMASQDGFRDRNAWQCSPWAYARKSTPSRSKALSFHPSPGAQAEQNLNAKWNDAREVAGRDGKGGDVPDNTC